MERLILQCVDDMLDIVADGKYSLDAQVRAYDLLDFVLSESCTPASLDGWFEEFQKVYSSNAEAIEKAFDNIRILE